MCKVSLEKRQEIFSEENCENMKEKSKVCSESDMKYIEKRMKAVEEIMQNPTSYSNAQKNVEETIDGLCEELPHCSIYIQKEYGKLCAKYGLDWK